MEDKTRNMVLSGGAAFHKRLKIECSEVGEMDRAVPSVLQSTGGAQ